MIASKVHLAPRWLSLIASILGASNGVAPCRLASSSRSFSSTNKNSPWESTNRLMSHGQATRSTFTSLRVIHFIFTSLSPGISEFNGEAILVELWRVGSDQIGKEIVGSLGKVVFTVVTYIISKSYILFSSMVVGVD